MKKMSILLVGLLASLGAVAAPQGDSLAQRMGDETRTQDQVQDQDRTMDQTRERKQLRTEDGSGNQYRYQYRNEYRKKGGDMEMNGSGMGGKRVGGGKR